MTGLEGRVLRRRQAVDAAARACAASSRSSRSSPRGSARRAAAATEPPRCSTSSPAPARRARRLRRHSATHRLDAERGAVLAVPADRRTHPGTPAPVPRPVPDPDGRARLVPVDHRRPGRRPAPRRAGLAGHRPGAAALPVRRADPPGAPSSPRSPGAVRRDPPGARRPPRRRATATTCGSTPARLGGRAGRGSPTRSARTRCSCRSTGPARAAPTGDQRRHRPGLGDAGVQGVRGATSARGDRSRVIVRQRVPAVTAPSQTARRGGRCRHGRRAVRRRAAAARPGRRSTSPCSAPRSTSRTTGCCFPRWSPGRLDVARSRCPRPHGPGARVLPGARGADRPRRPRVVTTRRRRARRTTGSVLATGARPAFPACSAGARDDGLPAGVHVLRTPRRRARRSSPRPSTPAARSSSAAACSGSRPRAGCRTAASQVTRGARRRALGP